MLLTFSVATYGQKGLPFTTDIELNRQFSDSRIGSIVQDGEESMYFSTSRGLLKFDGSRWYRIATPSPVLRVFHHSSSNRVFVGMKKGAMEVIRSDSGTFQVQPIPGISSDQPFAHIIGTDQDIFFVSETEIHRLTPLTKEPAEQFSFPDMFISGAFAHEGQLYVLFFQDGLFKWSENDLEMIGNYVSVSEDQMLFSFESDNGTYIGFESDLLFRFDGKQLNIAEDQLKKFLQDNLLSDGLLLNDTLMALSTLAGGAVVANIFTNDIEYRFDYSTGAKDNEIFCLGRDRDKGLWLAYQEGLTRVDLLQPVRSFGAYPGLEGNLTSSIMANGQLHVGTGNGVFVLRKASSQAEVQKMMEDMIRKKEAAKNEQTSNYIPPQQTVQRQAKSETAELVDRFMENPKEVKQELNRKEIRELKKELRRQRKEERQNKTIGESIEDFFTGGGKDEETEEEQEVEKQSGPDPMKGLIPNPTTGPAGSGMTAPPGSGGSARSKPQVLEQAASQKRVEEQEQKLKTIRNSYLFKKINGIDVKCRQLIQVGNEVFAATNNGLYIIKGDRAENLTPGLFVNQVARNQDGTKLLLATLKGVHALSKDGSGKWTARALNDTIEFVAYNVIEDHDQSIWAGTDNGAYRYFLDEVKYYPLTQVVNEKVLVANAYDKVHFLLPNSLYHYVNDRDTILPASLPEIPSSDRMDYMLGNDGQVWIRSSFAWHVINGEQFVPMLPYLDLFEDIRHLSTDDKGNIYVIDKGLNLFSVEHRNHETPYNFNVYIKQVKDASGQPFALGEMKIKTDGNAITFVVSAPFYLKSEGTQYQWRIDGLRNSWQKWVSDPEINPGIIPPGDYVLQVRARNILGEVSEIKTLAFSVPRPWYFRWYFVLLYVVVLVLIVWGIIKVRERSLKETQHLLEAKVAERTAELEKEKVKTEELLLNILPKDTADELQKNGKATARHYNQVSVLFTDFKGFTNFAENTSPEKLVDELHRYFVKFDEIIGKYYLEKIKTIGDAYMCAGGVPIRNSSNAIAITLAALEIRDYMTQVAADKRRNGELALDIRIGIHTGPLTAGVVGMKKFAYDIWGDTVNTASRMESCSEPGRINISGTTHEMIKKYFDTEYRGQREAKGKGLVDMYFVNAIKPEFSENGEGRVPNKGLWDLIS
ncbi:MAG: hypothetical protein H6601_10455 [Flavobacteriales bacterium]|nr:hypothetical protein [Flavobacteriales bacterium]